MFSSHFVSSCHHINTSVFIFIITLLNSTCAKVYCGYMHPEKMKFTVMKLTIPIS